MTDLPINAAPGEVSGARARLAAFIARHRRSLPLRKVAGLCRRYLGSYENFSYDMRSNGEAFVMQTIAGFKPTMIFDVGANVGSWSLTAHAACPAAIIHALEIAPPTFAALAANTSHLSQLRRANLGLSDANATIRIRHYDGFPALTTVTDYPHPFAFTEIDAQVVTGDFYAEAQGVSHIDFLKIDVEGMEERVFKGFQKMFAQRAIDLVQFEYGRVSILNHFLLRDAYTFFRANGYVIGKIFPTYVDFRDYQMSDEDFMGPNYLACREDRTDYIQALRGETV